MTLQILLFTAEWCCVCPPFVNLVLSMLKQMGFTNVKLISIRNSKEVPIPLESNLKLDQKDKNLTSSSKNYLEFCTETSLNSSNTVNRVICVEDDWEQDLCSQFSSKAVLSEKTENEFLSNETFLTNLYDIRYVPTCVFIEKDTGIEIPNSRIVGVVSVQKMQSHLKKLNIYKK